jgi:hypothetical protein
MALPQRSTLPAIRKGGGKPGKTDTKRAFISPSPTGQETRRIGAGMPPIPLAKKQPIPPNAQGAALTPNEIVLDVNAAKILNSLVEQYEKTGQADPALTLRLIQAVKAKGDETGDRGEGQEGYAGGGMVQAIKDFFTPANVLNSRRDLAALKAGTYVGAGSGPQGPQPAHDAGNAYTGQVAPPMAAGPAPTQSAQGGMPTLGGAVSALSGRKAQIDKAIADAEGYDKGGKVRYIPDYAQQFQGTPATAAWAEKKRYDEFNNPPTIGLDMTNWQAENPDVVRMGRTAITPPAQMPAMAATTPAAGGTLTGTRTLLKNPNDPTSTATVTSSPAYSVDAQGKTTRTLSGQSAVMPAINTLPAGTNINQSGNTIEAAKRFADNMEGGSFLGNRQTKGDGTLWNGPASASEKLDAYNRLTGQGGQSGGMPSFYSDQELRANDLRPTHWEMDTARVNAGRGDRNFADKAKLAGLMERDKAATDMLKTAGGMPLTQKDMLEHQDRQATQANTGRQMEIMNDYRKGEIAKGQYGEQMQAMELADRQALAKLPKGSPEWQALLANIQAQYGGGAKAQGGGLQYHEQDMPVPGADPLAAIPRAPVAFDPQTGKLIALSTGGGMPQGNPYKSREDIGKAFKSGAITKEQAGAYLQQLGIKP